MRPLRAGLVRLTSWWLALPVPLRLVAPIFVMLVLWYSSSQSPTSRAPSLLRAVLHNGAHVVAYAGLAGAWLLALLPPGGARLAAVTRRVVVVTIGLSVAYGIVDEVHQSFVPGRVSSLWDVACDACGSALAVLVALWTFTGERRFAVRVATCGVLAAASVAAATWLPG